MIVLSDGGDTSGRPIEGGRVSGARVFPIGIGASPSARDRAVLNLTAGEAVLPEAALDLSVSFVSRGFGTAPIDVRLSANGRPVEVRRVAPAADGAPVHQVFTVSPSPRTSQPSTPSTSSAAGTSSPGDNNRRSVLVPPQVGRRKILIVEGAPGFEHTFLKRALASRSRARRGRGRPQGTERRWPADVLRPGGGEPGRGAVERLSRRRRTRSSSTTRSSSATWRRSSSRAISCADLAVRRRARRRPAGPRRALVRASGPERHLVGGGAAPGYHRPPKPRRRACPEGGEGQAVNTPAVTTDGAGHPATRLARRRLEASRAIWKKLPAARLGLPGRRAAPGRADSRRDVEPWRRRAPADCRAAIRAGPDDGVCRRSVVALADAAARLGHGLRHDLASAGALAGGRLAGNGVDAASMAVGNAGDVEPVSVTVRNGRFEAVTDAQVSITVTDPDGAVRTLEPALDDARAGRYSVPRPLRSAKASIASMPRRAAVIWRSGPRTRHVLVGGADLEMADLALNEPVLQRLAAATGGRYLRAGRDGGASRPAEGRRAGACHRDEGPVAQRLDPARDHGTAGRRVAGPAPLRPGMRRREIRTMMRAWIGLLSLLVLADAPPGQAAAETRFALIVSGASGGKKYAAQMKQWRARPAVGAGRSSRVRREEHARADRRIRAGRDHWLGGQREGGVRRAPAGRDEGRPAAGRAARPRHVRRRRGQVQSGRAGPDRVRLEPDARRRARHDWSSSTPPRRAFPSSRH